MDLILPGHPHFNEWLATPPPDWENVASKQDGAFSVARADGGIFEAVNFDSLIDYLNGGEYDQHCLNQGMVWDEEIEDYFYPDELAYIERGNEDCPGLYWLPCPVDPSGYTVPLQTDQ